MAKATVHHACGHTSTVAERNRATADYRAAKLALDDCWECRKVAETAAAQGAAEAAGLPSLTGTPKQIAYGVVMRSGHLLMIDKAVAELRQRAAGLPSDCAAEYSDALILLEDEAKAWDSAKAWIEAPGEWESWLLKSMRDRGLVPRTLAYYNRGV